jgi:hypothetical protein
MRGVYLSQLAAISRIQLASRAWIARKHLSKLRLEAYDRRLAIAASSIQVGYTLCNLGKRPLEWSFSHKSFLLILFRPLGENTQPERR